MDAENVLCFLHRGYIMYVMLLCVHVHVVVIYSYYIYNSVRDDT